MSTLPDVKSYDTLVVGMGPAGATAAYQLSRAGLSVLGLDKATHPRYKVCGGGLSARIDRILEDDYKSVVEPFDPENGRRLLGPAMRADLIIDMSGEPGRSYAVTDSFYGEDFTYTLVRLAYQTAPRLRDKPLDASIRLPANPVPEPDLKDPDRHALMLESGMMSPRGPMMGMMGGGTSWAITRDIAGRVQSAQGMKPILTVARGRTCVLTLKNNTSWWHPMHLHGFSFRVLTRNGIPVRRTWHDTLLVEPNETADFAFVADNPGDWMLHCHVTDHQESGMMAVIRVS